MKKDVGRRTGDANTQIDFKLMKIHIYTKSTQNTQFVGRLRLYLGL